MSIFSVVFSAIFYFGLALQNPPATPFKLSPAEQALLDLTNAERTKQQLKPLKINAKLLAAARGHSANMAKQEKLDHELDGQGMAERIRAEGYVFSRAGENIAGKQATPKDAVTTWMNSEPHRLNILNPDFTEIGLGVVKSKKGDLYWTLVFAAPLEE